jgi:cell division protein FtsB
VVRPPIRERIVVKLASVELNPRALVARVPFVVLVIGSLGVGLGTTLWLSTDAAERSYQLSNARQTNQALLQQKEALERDVQKAQAAPALAEAARNLGMIPSRDTAHLVQDPAGNWIVVGTPKPAEGVPPAPLNTPLPDEAPPGPPAPPAPRVVDPRELSVRLPARQAPAPGVAVPGAPLVPAAPLTVPPGSEVPQALSPLAAPLGGPAPAAAPAPAPAAPLAVPPPAAAAPEDTPHLPTPAALPGPAPGAQPQAPVAPIPGAPA